MSLRECRASIIAQLDPLGPETDASIIPVFRIGQEAPRWIEIKGKFRRLRITDVTSIRSVAYIDGLTGLPNRLLIDTVASGRYFEDARRSSQDVVAMVLDVDGFKEVNDSYGHPYGDAFLRALVKRLLTVLPPNAIVARQGGDEFAVLARVKRGQGPKVVKDFCLALNRGSLEIEHDRGPHSHRPAITVGGASWWECGLCTFTELLGKADKALYAAKSRKGSSNLSDHCEFYANGPIPDQQSLSA